VPYQKNPHLIDIRDQAQDSEAGPDEVITVISAAKTVLAQG
jgi:hypothetical protein